MYIRQFVLYGQFREETPKNNLFLVAAPLREGGVKGRTNFFSEEKEEKNLHII